MYMLIKKKSKKRTKKKKLKQKGNSPMDDSDYVYLGQRASFEFLSWWEINQNPIVIWDGETVGFLHFNQGFHKLF